jgi:branched-chain amino acid transport system ATP-binding protein
MVLAGDAIIVGYGGDAIVRGVTVAVESGTLVALLGPNGAGKSTLIKALAGELTITSGSVMLDGRDVTKLPEDRRVLLGMGYVPQVGRVFGRLTVRENLEMGAYAVRGSLADRFDRVFGLFPDLKRNVKRHASLLSGGQQAMLGIGRALMGDAATLLLDEPTAGMSPAYVGDMWNALSGIKKLGIGVLIVEQNVAAALEHCDIGYVLADGVVVGHDKCSALIGREDVEGLFVG